MTSIEVRRRSYDVLLHYGFRSHGEEDSPDASDDSAMSPRLDSDDREVLYSSISSVETAAERHHRIYMQVVGQDPIKSILKNRFCPIYLERRASGGSGLPDFETIVEAEKTGLPRPDSSSSVDPIVDSDEEEERLTQASKSRHEESRSKRKEKAAAERAARKNEKRVSMSFRYRNASESSLQSIDFEQHESTLVRFNLGRNVVHKYKKPSKKDQRKLERARQRRLSESSDDNSSTTDDMNTSSLSDSASENSDYEDPHGEIHTPEASPRRIFDAWVKNVDSVENSIPQVLEFKSNKSGKNRKGGGQKGGEANGGGQKDHPGQNGSTNNGGNQGDKNGSDQPQQNGHAGGDGGGDGGDGDQNNGDKHGEGAAAAKRKRKRNKKKKKKKPGNQNAPAGAVGGTAEADDDEEDIWHQVGKKMQSMNIKSGRGPHDDPHHHADDEGDSDHEAGFESAKESPDRVENHEAADQGGIIYSGMSMATHALNAFYTSARSYLGGTESTGKGTQLWDVDDDFEPHTVDPDSGNVLIRRTSESSTVITEVDDETSASGQPVAINADGVTLRTRITSVAEENEDVEEWKGKFGEVMDEDDGDQDEPESGLTTLSKLASKAPSSASEMVSAIGGHSIFNRFGGGSSEGYGGAAKPGQAGLENLGNTCFMNSVIQCLSNTRELKEAFVDHPDDLVVNTSNPLGTGGALALSFGNVLNLLWSGEHSVVAPRDLKRRVGHLHAQFQGFQQHDAQEFMCFLLDGLHEDLNRIEKKPYVEAKSYDGKQALDEFARESWERYKMRNNSCIVDFFQGQLMSKLECSDCGEKSKTFDPVMYLSVPLTVKRQFALDILYVPHAQNKSGYKSEVQCIQIACEEGSTIGESLERLSELVDVPVDRLLTTLVRRRQLYAVLHDDEYLYQRDVKGTDMDIVVYGLPEGISKEQSEPEGPKDIIPDFVSYLVNISACVTDEQTECGNCGREEGALTEAGETVTLKRCSKCLNVAYCGTECQKTNWASHRHWCRAPTPRPLTSPLLVKMRPAEDPRKFISLATQYHMKSFLNEEGQAALAAKKGEIKVILDHSDIPGLEDQRSIRKAVMHLGMMTTNQSMALREWHSKEVMGISADMADLLSRGDVCNLYDCLNAYSHREHLSGQNQWYCPRCKTHCDAEKTLSLWSLPDVLIVHLKRFNFGASMFRGKIETFVDAPIRGLDMAPHLPELAIKHQGAHVYDLYGVVNHRGSAMFGHYIAYANVNPGSEDGWYEFDDSRVRKIEEFEVITPAAYVLFYKRRPIVNGANL